MDVKVNLANKTEEEEEETVPAEPSPQPWASHFDPDNCWWKDNAIPCRVEDLGEFDSGVPLEDCRRKCQEMKECYYFLHHPKK